MSRHASPTAQLLRNSRLFSLPQALPRPIVEQHIRDGSFRSSDSATTPYPLRQAIVTPKSSASRGDWGLKRSLPKRVANKSSEPAHTVAANDTYESISEYHSASLHVKTLEKFQELGIGMIREDQKLGVRETVLSAMDENCDFTDKETTPPSGRLSGVTAARGPSRRWKYEAAHVRTMTPSEFQTYIQEKVETRKDEFMLLLRARHHRYQLEVKNEGEKESLKSQDGPDDLTVLAAKSAYVNWARQMSMAVLFDYLSQCNTSTLSPKPATGTGSDNTASDAAQTSGQELLSESAAFTFSNTLKNLLKNEWWTPELEEDSSMHGELLRAKLAGVPKMEDRLPRPNRPSLADGHAPSWLKFLGLAEKYEKEFLRAWLTTEWDSDGSKFNSYLKFLRKDIKLDSPINRYIRDFLDMPPSHTMGAKRPNSRLSANESAFSLTTHPTAGLSYLKTNNILPNHPVLGPQRSAPPVKARVISPMSDRMLYGVAGFVGEGDQGKIEMGFDKPGGVKMDREISKVYVDGVGRIRIGHKQREDAEASAVRDGALEPPTGGYRISDRRPSGLVGVLAQGMDSGSKAGASKAKPFENKTVDRLKQLNSIIDRERGFKPTQS